MANQVVDFLSKQAVMDFTGRITLASDTEKALVFMQKGEVIQAFQGRIEGEKALLRIFVHFEADTLMVAEYEDVSPIKITIRKTFQELVTNLEKELKEYKELLEFFPKVMPELKPTSSFVIKGAAVTEEEMDVLYLCAKYGKFQDILDFSHFGDVEILKSLISLKKKDALS